jgi:hypothetical protein
MQPAARNFFNSDDRMCYGHGQMLGLKRPEAFVRFKMHEILGGPEAGLCTATAGERPKLDWDSVHRVSGTVCLSQLGLALLPCRGRMSACSGPHRALRHLQSLPGFPFPQTPFTDDFSHVGRRWTNPSDYRGITMVKWDRREHTTIAQLAIATRLTPEMKILLIPWPVSGV